EGAKRRPLLHRRRLQVEAVERHHRRRHSAERGGALGGEMADQGKEVGLVLRRLQQLLAVLAVERDQRVGQRLKLGQQQHREGGHLCPSYQSSSGFGSPSPACSEAKRSSSALVCSSGW